MVDVQCRLCLQCLAVLEEADRAPRYQSREEMHRHASKHAEQLGKDPEWTFRRCFPALASLYREVKVENPVLDEAPLEQPAQISHQAAVETADRVSSVTQHGKKSKGSEAVHRKLRKVNGPKLDAEPREQRVERCLQAAGQKGRVSSVAERVKKSKRPQARAARRKIRKIACRNRAVLVRAKLVKNVTRACHVTIEGDPPKGLLKQIALVQSHYAGKMARCRMPGCKRPSIGLDERRIQSHLVAHHVGGALYKCRDCNTSVGAHTWDHWRYWHGQSEEIRLLDLRPNREQELIEALNKCLPVPKAKTSQLKAKVHGGATDVQIGTNSLQIVGDPRKRYLEQLAKIRSQPMRKCTKPDCSWGGCYATALDVEEHIASHLGKPL